MDEALKELFERAQKKGWSQHELARRSGLSVTRINNWFCGLARPSWENLATLAALFDLQPEIKYVRIKKRK